MSLTVYRKAHFNAAHRLFRKDWDDAKNLQVFGKCSNPNYHGHNYELEVGISGEVDPETGFLIDLKILSDIIKEEVEDAFDHKNLNIEVPEFKNLNPTVENIAVVIWNKIRKRIDSAYGISVKLYETPRNFVLYKGN
ncbi:6-pyruvoyl trahydropterin synthase family protein [Aequorivita vladivostokensis]|uniref:6-carboxy-5,6,7,8-tetrahydropterin synthase n=1 Tax=Aequorivita vladivostokensis TaxID=171194 RepID=A0ABR5DES6_9FLAO|nr:6-carboxytetrahydropterin synthase [Aequorivita vladivostokensis]MAB58857.1 6-carboxytetrahydropterin synthase [Aequorivita sp.]KJJ37265.1 6-pyruvoyl tetrahydrobiopterin synthase [Aequorivita vladivostokensis]MAO47152.1 6-carboxytetrahydropterin synthase [Aequorivita sp.]MBF32574.1 6-carboxytetrahydropterin synthase [Aequorivita sp.]HAV53861.1 6-carboxytetrahydropterin synthase [Aequorivita sp.]|tara:strand:+ start:6532 stop:6942 length:411 start_codon:yes stop_codon:yes gene_type:complete